MSSEKTDRIENAMIDGKPVPIVRDERDAVWFPAARLARIVGFLSPHRAANRKIQPQHRRLVHGETSVQLCGGGAIALTDVHGIEDLCVPSNPDRRKVLAECRRIAGIVAVPESDETKASDGPLSTTTQIGKRYRLSARAVNTVLSRNGVLFRVWIDGRSGWGVCPEYQEPTIVHPRFALLNGAWTQVLLWNQRGKSIVETMLHNAGFVPCQ